jgi:hypothetical protein
MVYSRVQRVFVSAACGIGVLATHSTPLVGQSFVEVGGGWNYAASAPPATSYGNGFNIRVSVGRQATPLLGQRVDALTSQFALAPGGPQPCPCPWGAHQANLWRNS